jgi:pimeloyl-ACP methyl ester carboxylesterase
LLLALLVYAGYFFNYNLVYAGIAEEVTIQSGDIQLTGVLVKPVTLGPHPGIVLLHGAGPQTYSKWYYRIHTNAFVRQGFAVLSYDQRGSGNSEGNLRTVTFQDLINDGLAAVSFIRAQPDIIPDQIGLFGISESGWFTPEIAATDGDIAFIVNRVSPPLSWTTVVLFEWEMEAIEAGISKYEIEEILTLQASIYQYYIDVTTGESIPNGSERDAINVQLADIQNRHGDFMNSALPEYDVEEYSALASKYSYDPYPFLAEIDVPMLYIMAGKDTNVPTEASVALLEQLKLDLNKNITIETYPGASHYLYRWEWFPLEGFYVPGYLDLIGSWAAEQIEQK